MMKNEVFVLREMSAKDMYIYLTLDIFPGERSQSAVPDATVMSAIDCGHGDSV